MEEAAAAARAAAAGKGTVTPFASLFPSNEAQKAAKRVEEKIGEKEKELDCINEFVTENANLINLVSKLPDELNHEIMVPFGKAAFFPGRLIHTNEFMVLLGEGYYAERTAKQTVEILTRRGKVLDSQVESLKANMRDLKAEASFFDVTASEAAEGLVEIREDFVEENPSKKSSKSGKFLPLHPLSQLALLGFSPQSSPFNFQAINDKNDNKNDAVEDDEYARIMSRLDELEKEELEAEDEEVDAEDDDESNVQQHDAAESNDESDTGEQTDATESDSESHENMQMEAKSNQLPHQIHSETTKSGVDSSKAFTGSIVESADIIQTNSRQQAVTSPQASKPAFDSSKATTGSIMEGGDPIPTNLQQSVTSSQASKPAFDSSKAFTGSIVERTYNLPTSRGQPTVSSQVSNSQPSKPVSRFKMRRP
ncbi:unnamed protein product [Dovyalis caffra]|uniref:RNA polymerase II subunit 5-mediating protein homolog n=1 Tax=Dovyalis caffra TaxID=77055 RepID=A0AAV1QM51_9ROSI|nr:unnamed protein product [Dovyalis caffra]